MAGLRAKQKADKNRRILESATALFREQGYDSARIEDIAEMAEVSVGTLYNYYQNKGDILVATVAMEVTEVLEGGAKIVASPPMNVEEALKALIRAAVALNTSKRTAKAQKKPGRVSGTA